MFRSIGEGNEGKLHEKQHYPEGSHLSVRRSFSIDSAEPNAVPYRVTGAEMPN